MSKKLSVTVVIPTCYGGDSLIKTAESIYASKNVGAFRFIIISDRTPIKPETKKKLEKMGIEVYWNDVEGSQPKKLLQARNMVKDDLYVFTQDDIYFDPNALSRIVNAFEDDPKLTMAATGVLPVTPSQTYVELAMASNIRMVYNTARHWNHGDNYLAASGRCMIFRMNAFKKFRIPEILVNADMYFYLENKRMNGRFAMLPEAKVYIRPPQHLKDQIGPSSRFQYQKAELKKFFDFNYANEYQVPPADMFQSVMHELLTHPIGLLTYLYVFGYTRLNKQPMKTVANPVWAVDASTKKM